MYRVRIARILAIVVAVAGCYVAVASDRAPSTKPPTGAEHTAPHNNSTPRIAKHPASAADFAKACLPSRAAEARILKALEQPADFEFHNVPLSTVAKTLQAKLKIPFCIDRKAMQALETRLDGKPNVTFERLPVSSRAALEIMLEDLDLTWMVRYDIVWITTWNIKQNTLETRVVDISERNSAGEYVYPIDEQLLELITSTVAPQSWDGVGGTGTIKEYHANGLDCFVISQTLENHEAIENLLQQLRQTRIASRARNAGLPNRPRAKPETGFVGGLSNSLDFPALPTRPEIPAENPEAVIEKQKD